MKKATDTLPLSTAQLARVLGIGPRKLERAVAGGVVTPLPRGNRRASTFDGYVAIQAYIEHALSERVVTHLDAEQQRARRDKAQADLAELRHARESGALVATAEFERILSPVVASIRSRLLALPRGLAARLAGVDGPTQIEHELMAAVRQSLTDLADIETYTGKDSPRPRTARAGREDERDPQRCQRH